MVNEDIERADEQLDELNKPIKVLTYVDPINSQEQRDLFMNSDDYEPLFEYKTLEFSPIELIKQIESVPTDDSPIGQLINEKRLDLVQKVLLLENRNSSNFREISTSIYGKPSEQLTTEAKELLDLKDSQEELSLNATDIQKFLKTSLEEYGFDGWKLILDESLVAKTRIKSGNKQICINPNKRFSEREAQRLKFHEIGVHVLRKENGILQPYNIFKNGTPGYLPTEEGLTLTIENNLNVLDNRLMRNYAGRVLAIDLLLKEATFRQTYTQLTEFGFNEDDAYTLTLRTFRGGGYTKDYIYLQGYKDVKGFLNKGGNLDTLLIGKIGLKDVPLVESLLKDKELVPAKYKLIL